LIDVVFFEEEEEEEEEEGEEGEVIASRQRIRQVREESSSLN